MLIPHKGHTDTMQVYSVTVMTHVEALQAGHSSQGTSEPITPGSTPCELRLMLPDTKLGIDGFHDVIIENFSFLDLEVVTPFAGGHFIIAPALAESCNIT